MRPQKTRKEVRTLNIEESFRRYKNDVYRLALSYTRSPAEAEDVCQTVFLKRMEQKSVDPDKEKAWLLQVTANICRNLLRSHWWKTTAPLEDSGSLAAPQHREVWDAVMSLEPKYRVVIYLRYYEEYSTREMAQLLRISQSAVTTRLNRARQMLREQLKEGYL